ncbi:MAG: excinuclease ABC subunit B [Elusimicrobia bacterium GWC2_65_9]|nr:MAG: excinuclease ABC subunit B [Elusimicrobia bacterium GWA2_66_18]OGR73120.1 MAG: excinuclease ABC subunit B [Elusimicrobia bacterium GWC2_65_9]
MGLFRLRSSFEPAGDQPQAIDALVARIREGAPAQTLLGVTGSGKTFAVANMIQRLDRPALVLSPNKVLAAQLYAEFKSFFPDNAVEFFISYYDYYQPEAYVPSTDTYIEKDSSINDRIDRLRLKCTSSLLARRDVVVVASVSAIYNIGSPEVYAKRTVPLEVGWKVTREELLARLVSIHYERNETQFTRGKFRVKGGVVDIFPAYMETALRATLEDGEVAALSEFDPLTGHKAKDLKSAWVYPAKHFVTDGPERKRAIAEISAELARRLESFRSRGKLLEAQRLEQRTRYDLEMLREIGFCRGIENYSRHLSGRPQGARPNCLIDFFPKDHLLVVDESHAAIPQIGGMYEGDRARKQTLVDFGWRLPSALDNRPLKFSEFEALAGQTVFVSATPGPYELKRTKGSVVEMVVRPTGLVDPETIIRPSEGQLDDLIVRVKERVARRARALVTTLTKRTAEDLASYLTAHGLKARYLHSDIDSLERIQILQDLRAGVFDVLVGVNLLREGLDLPEVSLVAILGADHEGFLRSETTLIQISGRAARNVGGQVILYADAVTGSMKRALGEMDRRRAKQIAYNAERGIRPRTIIKAVSELEEFQTTAKREGLMLLRETERPLRAKDLPSIIQEVEGRMRAAADALDFEAAAFLRDQLFELKGMSASRPAGKKW